MNPRTDLISACGLYCGACHKFKKGDCLGCREIEKAAWCKIRPCTEEKGYTTCAECQTFENVNDCKKFNTLFAKFFALVFKSDRKASLERISKIGPAAYAQEMETNGVMVIKGSRVIKKS